MNPLFPYYKTYKTIYSFIEIKNSSVRFLSFPNDPSRIELHQQNHIRQIVTQNPDTVQRVVLQQQVITTRT